ncbi:hypothetical protein FC50_GL000548 [Lacticaseibacillus pantheris DSM 15945 = JCM 12539 = NBRC 106106]|uniref:Uncharacterized protein n=1 Tax=Lacticaseibacillus pantheris DSM 15945 = JCM 12539 = NBRC 106106 TaxID=1423783 RepID=A0A0R1U443_9LACO|nr:hypothetical protein FC50_GL000548 [Lacticaseibacillus pantheris DSM 15945 = JCM 12539 = NBRC 106106]
MDSSAAATVLLRVPIAVVMPKKNRVPYTHFLPAFHIFTRSLISGVGEPFVRLNFINTHLP